MPEKDDKGKAKKAEATPKVVTEIKAKTKMEEKPVAAPPEPKVSFGRWFRARKFKPHWAAGMQAYTDTRRRRTMDAWDDLFKNY